MGLLGIAPILVTEGVVLGICGGHSEQEILSDNEANVVLGPYMFEEFFAY